MLRAFCKGMLAWGGCHPAGHRAPPTDPCREGECLLVLPGRRALDRLRQHRPRSFEIQFLVLCWCPSWSLPSRLGKDLGQAGRGFSWGLHAVGNLTASLQMGDAHWGGTGNGMWGVQADGGWQAAGAKAHRARPLGLRLVAGSLLCLSFCPRGAADEVVALRGVAVMLC